MNHDEMRQIEKNFFIYADVQNILYFKSINFKSNWEKHFMNLFSLYKCVYVCEC